MCEPYVVLAQSAATLSEQVDKLPRPWGFLALMSPLLLITSLLYKAVKIDPLGPALLAGLRMFAVCVVVFATIGLALYGLIRL